MNKPLPSNRRTRDSLTGPPPPSSEHGRPSVRPSRPPAPSKPKVWFGRLRFITGVIVVVGASVLVAFGLRRYLHHSPRFAVKTVYVDGNARRTAHQIARAGDIAIGKNIFQVDEHNAALAIGNDPWVEKATVRRDLPNTIRIQVVEREAHLLVTLQDQLFLVDGRGVVFKQWHEGDPADLPVVTGLSVTEATRDRKALSARLRRVLQVKTDLERRHIDKHYPLQEVNLMADGTMHAVVGTDGITLELGRGPYRKKIDKASHIFSELRRRRATADRIFLDNETRPERVVVRMR